MLSCYYPAQFQIVKVRTESVQPGLKREKTGDAVCSLYLTNCTVCDAQTKQMAMQMKLFLQQVTLTICYRLPRPLPYDLCPLMHMTMTLT